MWLLIFWIMILIFILLFNDLEICVGECDDEEDEEDEDDGLVISFVWKSGDDDE